MGSYDTFNLRHSADFRTLIGRDTYWVPVRELGETRYTNEEIEKICACTPEEKREKINTLYEAIQLFQVGNFKDKSDVQKREVDGIKWELHKPGYWSVVSNEGCCASAASWLTYILDDKYEEIGFLSFVRANGSGHVMNYIYHENYYYIVDMLSMTSKYRDGICAETGDRKDYARLRHFTGICTRVRELEEYERYFNRILYRSKRMVVLTRQMQKEVSALSVEHGRNGLSIIYPRAGRIQQLTYNIGNVEIKYIDVNLNRLGYTIC